MFTPEKLGKIQILVFRWSGGSGGRGPIVSVCDTGQALTKNEFTFCSNMYVCYKYMFFVIYSKQYYVNVAQVGAFGLARLGYMVSSESYFHRGIKS